MKKLLLLATLLVLAVSSAMAAPLCTAVTNQNVMNLNAGGGCELDGLVFDMFAVASVPAGGMVALSTNGTGIANGTVNLGFQLFGGPNGTPPGDIILEYRVTGGIFGVDIAHNGVDVRIQEVVCSVSFATGNGNCPAGSILANLVNPPNTVAFFAPQTQVYIQKDIQYNSTNSFISSFTNSHHVPEPMTSLLVGAGLVGVAFIRRRLHS